MAYSWPSRNLTKNVQNMPFCLKFWHFFFKIYRNFHFFFCIKLSKSFFLIFNFSLLYQKYKNTTKSETEVHITLERGLRVTKFEKGGGIKVQDLCYLISEWPQMKVSESPKLIPFSYLASLSFLSVTEIWKEITQFAKLCPKSYYLPKFLPANFWKNRPQA